MSSKRVPVLTRLLNSVEGIRNVCILAHVDHGKTTIADALLATNGIVSMRQAGKLRYMDNTEAEQQRGITMKSSVVGLSFSKMSGPDQSNESTFLVNLVDSPGHVDFASEVSTAVRLCDAAVIVVDVVESVCPQTRAVLRQAWNERLTLILVLNKIDRLIVELKMTPMQAYDVVCRVIEQVNSVLAEMFTADLVRQRDDAWQSNDILSNPESERSTTLVYDLSDDLNKTDDSNLYFSPDRGNVVFSSAIDSWGFRPVDLVSTWAERLGVSRDQLNEVIWGDFYISKSSCPATDGQMKVSFKPNARRNKHKPVFVQLILEPLWKAYQTLLIDGNQGEVSSMASKLGVRLDARSIRHTDNRSVLRALLMSWLPLGHTLLSTIVDVCPDPRKAVSADRAVHMFYGDQATAPSAQGESLESGELFVNQTSRFELNSAYAKSSASLALQSCNSSPDAPTIVFVAKVFWTEKLHMLETNPLPRAIKSDEHSIPVAPEPLESSANQEHNPLRCNPDFSKLHSTRFPSPQDPQFEFVALARIFSGSVYPGQRLFVLGPKFDGSKIPHSLLDANPSDFPVGPVRVRTDDDEDGVDVSLNQSNDLLGSSPAASSSHTPSRSGSVGSSSVCLHTKFVYLRHVYVAVVLGVHQLLGGQHDLVSINGPVPAGNIVGLTGPDLITFLPKSGLLVSSLSLVAGPPDGTVDTESCAVGPVLPLAGLAVWHGAPVLSVAVEPASASNPDDVTRLERGLRLLDRADPCAEVSLAPSGEYLIKAAGEVHLQKCLEDLAKFFAPDVELHVSPFVVPFRETIIAPCEDSPMTLDSTIADSYQNACRKLESILQQIDTFAEDNLMFSPDPVDAVPTEPSVNETGLRDSSSVPSVDPTMLKSRPSENPSRKRGARDLVNVDFDLPALPIGFFQLPHSKTQTRVLIRVTAHPMPQRLIDWAETVGRRKVPQLIRAFKTKSPNYPDLVARFNDSFSALCRTLPTPSVCWSTLSGSFLALGPNQTGPNMLFARLKSTSFPIFTAWGQQILTDRDQEPLSHALNPGDHGNALPLSSYAKALLRGFQLATERGPLCAEPMRGVAFIVEEICAEDCYFLQVPRWRYEEQLQAVAKEDAPVEPVREATPDEVKRKAREKRIKAKRLTSISWLDDLEQGDGEDDEVDDEFFLDGEYDSMESFSGSELGEVSEENEIANPEDADGKPNRMKQFISELHDIPYWSRREDIGWLHGVLPGLLTSAMNRACLAAFQACPGQRLLLAMYDVELQARPDVLGRMFAVLRKRHGRVVSEDFREGENLFIINARLPVVESFGLAVELRSRTSGVVSLPQLRPGGWELLDIDPTQKETVPQDVSHPTSVTGKKLSGRPAQPAAVSDDEDAKPDELSAQISRVRSYIKDVRMRKGLPINEQLVQFADKQRTLKKNK